MVLFVRLPLLTIPWERSRIVVTTDEPSMPIDHEIIESASGPGVILSLSLCFSMILMETRGAPSMLTGRTKSSSDESDDSPPIIPSPCQSSRSRG